MCRYGKVRATKCKVPVKCLLISKVILSRKTHIGKNTNKHCPLADMSHLVCDWPRRLAVDAPLGTSRCTDRSPRAQLHDAMREHPPAPEFSLQAHPTWEPMLPSKHAQSHLRSCPAWTCQQVHLPGCNFRFVPCVLPRACQPVHVWTARHTVPFTLMCAIGLMQPAHQHVHQAPFEAGVFLLPTHANPLASGRLTAPFTLTCVHRRAHAAGTPMCPPGTP